MTYQKLQLSLEQTLKKLAEVEQELEKLKKERAMLLKRIPCTLEKCERGKMCENSHLLKYEDRSEPKSNKWRKTVPCRYYLNGRCDKSDEECNFLHERPDEPRGGRRRSMMTDQGANRYPVRESEDEEWDNEESFNQIMNHRFRAIRDERADSSVEFMEEVRRGDREGSNMNGKPFLKRRRLDSTSSMPEPSGNGGGAGERSRHSVPVNYQRSEDRYPTMRLRINQRPGMGESRERNWSPIRSPEELDRSRPRDRDLREEMEERRGRGRGNRGAPYRGRGVSRGQGERGRGYQGRAQEPSNPRSGRDYGNQNHQNQQNRFQERY